MMGMDDCESYCRHGGKCVLAPFHTGVKHRSARFANDPTACEWTDAEAITRADADRMLIRKGPRGIRIVIEQRLSELIRKFAG